MSIKVCLREVMTHGIFNECISININTHQTFFDGIENLGIELLEQFGYLYRTTNISSGDTGFLQYAEICYDDILLVLDYLTTTECRESLTNNEINIEQLQHDFNSMKLYLELHNNCDFFSVYIL